jgi:hypothetical protein
VTRESILDSLLNRSYPVVKDQAGKIFPGFRLACRGRATCEAGEDDWRPPSCRQAAGLNHFGFRQNSESGTLQKPSNAPPKACGFNRRRRHRPGEVVVVDAVRADHARVQRAAVAAAHP